MNVALVLSGGTGSRLGSDIPKQYLKVADRTVISYCLETILESSYIDAVQIVADKQWHEVIEESLVQLGFRQSEKVKGFSTPGENRQLSILNGLYDISKYAKETDLVMIHDAARPMLTEDTIKQIFDTLEVHEGVIPVLPMKDTVYLSDGGEKISALLNRSQVFAGQAPEGFILGKYFDANKKLLPDAIYDINGSTEPAVLYGMDVTMIPGDEGNFKITTKEDLRRFEAITDRGI